MAIGLTDFDAFWRFNSDFSDATGNGHAVTPIGAVIDNITYKIGGGSAFFDDIDDYGTIADSSIWDLDGNDFSIILGVRFHTSVAGQNPIMTQWNGGGANDRGWTINYFSNALNFEYTTNGITYKVVSRSWTPSLNTWYLIYVLRIGNVMQMYIDNVQLGADITFADTIYNATITPAFNTFFANGNPSSRAGVYLDACGKMPTAATSQQRDELWNGGAWNEMTAAAAAGRRRRMLLRSN